ncbi:helix-turn-helix transcriptional regulator [Limnoglobus roseus]|uniref:Transcriptional regulator n=1 Tax=Limnoglobus roseus TaxID=2598579 RepID=A0A5C1AGY1_9BACT|nr:LuxR C-terminal-related transcriptional regulator [Limnoglobus roseus]QEL16364.1 transcriptional regulator [Limnoglobus roseus]
MSKSQRVTAADEVAILRLMNECRELGDDAMAWQQRLISGLQKLTGGMVAAVGPTPPLRGELGVLQEWVGQQLGGGWPSESLRRKWEALAADPMAMQAHPAVSAFWAMPEPSLSLTRREIVPDHVWDRSPFVNDLLRADGMDEGLVSRADVPVIGGGYVLTVVRAKGEQAFSRRAGAVVAALLRELEPHLGRGLFLTSQPNLHGLSPRLRQVLGCLLDGDSEKEAALRCRLHPTTVHEYVKHLYRHFGVSSRAELLAYFLRRYPRR